MRNRIVIILLSLLLATPALAGVGAFQKFSMGIMLGLGPSYMTGEDADLYDDNWSAGGGLAFRMADTAAVFRTGITNLVKDENGPMWTPTDGQTGIIFPKSN